MEGRKRKYVWRIIRKICVITLLSVASLMLLVCTLLYLFEDKIKAAAISQLNEHLTAPVLLDTKDIELTFLSSFPNASIQFSHFKIRESYPGSQENVADVGTLRLEFNPFDLIEKNYHIKRIVLKDANIRLRVNDAGEPNYLIWKQDTTVTVNEKKERLSLDLKRIVLVRVKASYENVSARHNIAADIAAATFSGRFTDDNYDMESEAKLNCNRLMIDGVTYAADKKLYYKTVLAVNRPQKEYSIREAKLLIGSSGFEVKGSAKSQAKGLFLDFSGRSQENDIQSLLALLPDKYTQSLADYKSSGRIMLSASVHGYASKGQTPAISADFLIRNGNIRYKEKPVSLTAVNLEGKFSNGSGGQSSALRISHFSGQLNGHSCSGSMLLSNLADPYLTAALKADVDLKDLLGFMNISAIKSLDGKMLLDASFKGRIADLKTYNTIGRTQLAGSMSLNNVTIVPAQGNISYAGLSGEFHSNGKDLLVPDFTGHIGHSDFKLQGSFRNLSSFIFLPNQKLDAEANLYSHLIDLNDFIQSNPTATAAATQADNTEMHINYPSFLVFDFKLNADKLVYRKLETDHINGHVSLRQDGIDLLGLNFQTMGGSVSMNAQVKNTPGNKFTTTGRASLKGIAVDQFFYQMENLGQTAITDRNLKGDLDANMDFYSVWNDNLSIDLNTLTVSSALSIDKGQLVQYEPMMQLGKFLKIKTLDHLYFSKLQNTITIRDRKLIIPKMDINSSAVNMAIAGTHTFDNYMDYKLKVNISQLLFGKEGSYKAEFNEAMPDERGGLNLFVSMTGPADKLSIKYDRKESAQNLKLGIKQEGQDLKRIFNKQGPDGLPVQAAAKKQVSISWDDKDEAQATPQPAAGNTAKPPVQDEKKKQGTLFNKIKNLAPRR